MELRYGGKALKLSGDRTAVEVGDKAKLTIDSPEDFQAWLEEEHKALGLD